MAHRKPPPDGVQSTGRGNHRTRGGAGRHNHARAGSKNSEASIRVCLGCDRPFRSRGPWNRLCGRCREQEHEEQEVHVYPVPGEWPRSILYQDDF